MRRASGRNRRRAATFERRAPFKVGELPYGAVCYLAGTAAAPVRATAYVPRLVEILKAHWPRRSTTSPGSTAGAPFLADLAHWPFLAIFVLCPLHPISATRSRSTSAIIFSLGSPPGSCCRGSPARRHRLRRLRTVPNAVLATIATWPIWLRFPAAMVSQRPIQKRHRWRHEVPFHGASTLSTSAETTPDFLVSTRAHPAGFRLHPNLADAALRPPVGTACDRRRTGDDRLTRGTSVDTACELAVAARIR